MQEVKQAAYPIEQNIDDQLLQYPSRDLKCAIGILFICLIFLCLTMILNIAIQTPLFLQGLNFIYSYQTATPQLWVRNFSNVISSFSFPNGVATVIFLYFVIAKRKLMLTIHLLYYFFCTYAIALPLIFYLHNLTQRPMFLRDVDNIEKQCGIKQVLSQKVQQSMLVGGCSIGSLSFGLIYGCILLRKREEYLKYFLGRWHYQSKIKIPLSILVYLICAGVPFFIFSYISNYVLHNNAVGDYLLYIGATTGVGIALTFLVPMLIVKLNIISFQEEEWRKQNPKTHKN